MKFYHNLEKISSNSLEMNLILLRVSFLNKLNSQKRLILKIILVKMNGELDQKYFLDYYFYR